jgi:hypothetical protein
MRFAAFLIMSLFFLPVAMAEEKLDANDQIALMQTQALLKDKNLREEAAKNDPKASAVMSQIKTLSGGNAGKEEEMYGVASDIFKDVATQEGGDRSKIDARLQNALKDPEAFINSLSPEQRAKMKNLIGSDVSE